MQYQLIRSSRKTLAVEIREGYILVRAPYRTPLAEIDRFLRERRDWIESHQQKSLERQAAAAGVTPLTYEEMQELGQKAAEYLPGRVKHYAMLLGVSPRKITIRNQRTRWGSCSTQGNLNFNCLLMLTPPEVIDSVVVHELCHLIEMNHSKRFYEKVYSVYPEYDKWHGWLREHQPELMARLG